MGKRNNKRASLIGRFDCAMYGDLLENFGPGGPMSDEYLAQITGSSVSDVRSAHHNARNDSGVRDAKPDANPK